MIYEMHLDLADRLAARKFPQRVLYGAERTQREGYDPVIVVERWRGGDTVSAPMGSQRNPRRYATRTLGVEIRIYAKSPLQGAHVGDHERDCEQIVNGVIVALLEWAHEEKRITPEARFDFSETRYLTAAERGDVESWAGVAYVIRGRVGMGVLKLDYLNEAEPTAELAGISNTTRLYYKGQESDPPEIGCGEEP